ncbi:tRNA preQ1(34) S-adenosylmethionine ribosyltransferase-isomerase QueA [Deferribacterales bacterium Es71-Z0220]|uniref:tRNA preQ1(34) S-adenosylmethionine ribosyltransferase-isomerase QueA n=1 Tax=Deferrivibrio essentukiensis TaxID=2880922 RepID=UPI001F61D910|nr:tRNA preQ1(34) S-adenosylmethionine ribosyltransferase-isomerase QueA [Deferrivibrio essentukiensis]MCB4204059.1 tRNA preQ1(34) S-adenosylmethionine ribosyltransferase-isomerase QueA [Deferrivibrio essentukiensis]
MQKTPINKFDFNLPDELIAQSPAQKRDESRLLYLNKEHNIINELQFKDIVNLLTPNDFLVVNNTKVLKARLYGKKETGGKVEVLLTDEIDKNTFQGMVRGKVKEGDKIIIEGNKVTVKELIDEIRVLEFDCDPYKLMEKFGHIPLPPYIKRDDTKEDHTRYQTVYSKNEGSVAAPTAGLHFTTELMEKLKNKGVEVVEITLNVGIGTFKPVKADYIEDHKMHSEKYFISEEARKKINDLKNKGKKLVAVGTTSVRALESIATDTGYIENFGAFSTDIFITPGYKFKIVDKLITNFHLPKSTLLMLVSAFAGYDFTMNAYKHAVNNRYRFFSYGDAMFIE